MIETLCEVSDSFKKGVELESRIYQRGWHEGRKLGRREGAWAAMFYVFACMALSAFVLWLVVPAALHVQYWK